MCCVTARLGKLFVAFYKCVILIIAGGSIATRTPTLIYTRTSTHTHISRHCSSHYQHVRKWFSNFVLDLERNQCGVTWRLPKAHFEEFPPPHHALNQHRPKWKTDKASCVVFKGCTSSLVQ